MKNRLQVCILLLTLLLGGGVHAQVAETTSKTSTPAADTVKTKPEKDCKQQAIGDLFRKKEKAPKPPKKFMALILPNISSNPSNGFLLGIGGTFGWYMGPKENTRVSSAPFTVAVTSKKQLITFVKSNIYTKEDKFFLQGDWRFYIYSQPTYGLGTNSPDTSNLPSGFHWDGQGGSTDSASFPMKYNLVKFSEIINRKIVENFYAGIGYHLDYYYSIEDENLAWWHQIPFLHLIIFIHLRITTMPKDTRHRDSAPMWFTTAATTRPIPIKVFTRTSTTVTTLNSWEVTRMPQNYGWNSEPMSAFQKRNPGTLLHSGHLVILTLRETCLT